MISKEEFFSRQEKILDARKSQITSLLEKIKKYVSLSGDKLLSLGCGTAYETQFLKNDFKQVRGVDIDPAIIDFCKEKYESKDFICENNMVYLERQEDNSLDCILCLDIDTNIFPQRLLFIAKNKLKKGACIVFSERQNNIVIYDRMLLLPLVKDIKKQFEKDFIFFEEQSFLDNVSSMTRDNFLLICQRK